MELYLMPFSDTYSVVEYYEAVVLDLADQI